MSQDAPASIRDALDALRGALAAHLDDGATAAGGGLARLGHAAAGLWELLGNLDRRGVNARVTLDTTVPDLIAMLPEHAREAIGAADARCEGQRVVASYDVATRRARLSARRVALHGLRSDVLTIDRVRIDGLRLRADGDHDSFVVGVAASRVRIEGVRFVRRADLSIGRIDLVDLGFEADDVAPDADRVDDPSRPIRASLRVARARVGDVADGAAALVSLVATAVVAGLDQAREAAWAEIEAVEARDAVVAGLRVGSVHAATIVARATSPGGGLPLLDRRPDHPRVDVTVSRVEVAGGAAPFGHIDAATVDDVAVHGEPGVITGRLAAASGRGVAGPLGLAAATFVIRDANGRVAGRDVTAHAAHAELTDAAAAVTGTGGDVHRAAWLAAGAAVVREADVHASARLAAGEVAAGPIRIGIAEGTRAEADVAVAGGRLVPERTGVRFEEPLDGPLWTTVRGARVTDGGRIRAEIGGFPDPYVTGAVSERLGLDGDRVPLALDELAAKVLDRLDQSRAAPPVGVESGDVSGRVRLGGRFRTDLADVTLPDAPGRNELTVQGAWPDALAADGACVLAESIVVHVADVDLAVLTLRAEGVHAEVGADGGVGRAARLVADGIELR